MPFWLWGQLELDLLPSSCTNQWQHYNTLENPLRVLGLNAYNHTWTYQVSYIFPPPALVLVLSEFVTEHITGEFRLLILVAPCWMQVSWLPMVLSMLEAISYWCPAIKDLIVDVLVVWVLKDLPLLHLTLWLLRNICSIGRVLFISLSGGDRANQTSAIKVYQQCWKEWAGWLAEQGVSNSSISSLN